MKIFFDNIIFNLQASGGISVYWYEIIKRFLNEEGVSFFESHPSQNIFRKRIKINENKIIRETSLPLSILRCLNLLKKLPPQSIFHSSYYRMSSQKDVFNIVTVHDFISEYYKKGLVQKIHQIQKGCAIKKAKGIICISESTKKDLLKFHPKTDPNNITVIYNGISDEFFPQHEWDESQKEKFQKISKNYILFIGDRGSDKASYKNFHLAVDVMSELKDFEFVLVGGGCLSESHKQYLDSKISGSYHHFLGLGIEDLNALYNKAFCLLYPSEYEGFGIPVAEAMKVGCPTIAVNRSSLPEVMLDAGLKVEEASKENFIKAIHQLKDENFRNNLVQKGFENAKRFSWEKCFEETKAFYNKIYEKNL